MLWLFVSTSCLFALTWAASPYHNPNCADGRLAMVHLFEWRWEDIAAECERFLGPMGYCGVQTSSPTENVVIVPPEHQRPWWERYQPVSYKLETRSGNEEQFIDMVNRCNAVGVRIYPDVVINHMTGVGRKGIGTGGSSFDADEGDYPGVPYTMPDFNTCENCGGCCCINAWMDVNMVRNCRLLGLIDINQALEYPSSKIVEFLNKLIDIGVAGFRVDAAKHMWPKDLENMFARLNDLNTAKGFPSGRRPFMALEVIDMNQNGEVNAKEYINAGIVTDFRYCVKIKEAEMYVAAIRGIYDQGWGMLAPEDAFVFVDNHDNQRGHGAGGDVLTHKKPHQYKKAAALMLAYPHGHPRVMSSFEFTNTDEGPPHDVNWNTKPVPINQDGSCGDGWVCEHRWKPIAGMASFSKAVSGTGYDNWWESGNKIAFSRGNKGFFAISGEGPMTATIQTGLPAGQYCNVIEGCATSSGCVGQTVTVNGDGSASISIQNSDEPILAIHVEARAGSGGCVAGSTSPTVGPPQSSTTGAATTTTTPSPATTATAITTTPDDPNQGSTTQATSPTTTSKPGTGYQRTVIFVNAQTDVGNDMFVRGGISHDLRPGCSNDAATSPCAIPIDHNELGSTPHYDKYNAWKVGDTKLDWYGKEVGQGSYNGQQAEGTPAVWTSNQQSSSGYQPLNKWGDHYWMVEFDMDCSDAEKGWFEFKSFITGRGWEQDLSQVASCAGSVGGSAPFSNNNHVARCGYINMFVWNSNACTIDDF